ncbi:MAG TPA: hypothetical protein VFZ09_30710 [Archangium sp.]|uniref:hypothetical protein n=1 Tax=Archangium sp. TaxID=1872627 RepID=UPI002E3089C3|nr:hypothetical protein [Archangium sp.]HEX5750639.1 hypothetical protein [Archangium sp.]
MNFDTTIFVATLVILGAGLLVSSSKDNGRATARARERPAEPPAPMRPVLLFSTTRPPVVWC